MNKIILGIRDLFDQIKSLMTFNPFPNDLRGQRKCNSKKEARFTYSFSPSLTCVPPYSGRRTVSPSLTETGINFPSLSLEPGPTAITLPELSCKITRKCSSFFRSFEEEEIRRSNRDKQTVLPWWISPGGECRFRFLQAG